MIRDIHENLRPPSASNQMPHSSSRAILTIFVVTLLGCGARFVEPNPPELSRHLHIVEASIIDEPIAWLLLIDLQIGNANDCAAAQARIDAQLRESLTANGRSGAPLATVEIAPACTQQPFRRLDLPALEKRLVDARDRLSPRLRPLIVYVNNVDLQIGAELAADLAVLSERYVASGGMRPVTLVIAPAEAREGLLADHAFDWTFSGDAALTSALLSFADAHLPHRTQIWSTVPPPPLLTPDLASSAAEFKVCHPDERIEPVGFALDGNASRVDPQSAPHYRILLPDALALPASSFAPETIAIEVEICRAHCDRYVRTEEGALVAWNAVPGCFSDGDAEEMAN